MPFVTTAKTFKGRGIAKVKVVITTAADGTVAETVVGSVQGRLVGVGYKPGTLATGVDITVKDYESGATVFSLTDAGTSARFFRPTQVITTVAGVAVTAATTAVDVNRDIFLSGKLSVTVAQGGNAFTGELHLIVAETGF